jgi:hypothetical protein
VTWTDVEPAGPGRFVWHAVVVREGGHVWGKGWFRSRAEAAAALADMERHTRECEFGRRNPTRKAIKVMRVWRSDADSDAYGGDWHRRVTDLNTERRVIGKLPR